MILPQNKHVIGPNGPTFQGPGAYRIRIMGRLEQHWLDVVGDVRSTTSTSTDGRTMTTLVGHFRDQAALLGLLNTLYDLHLTLVGVEYLHKPRDDQHDSGA